VLTTRLADILVSRKQYDRACKLVNGFADAESRIAWLEARSQELASAGCLLSAHALFKSKAMRLGSQTAELFGQEARRLAALGDTTLAVDLAEQVIECAAAADSVRASAALLVVRYADKQDQERAIKVLQGLVRITPRTPQAACMTALCDALKSEEHRWRAPVIGALWLAAGVEHAKFVVETCCMRGSVGAAETILLLWALEALRAEGGGRLHVIGADLISDVLMRVGEYLQRCAEEHTIGLWEIALLSEWDLLKTAGSPDVFYPSLEAVRASARSVQARVIAQRSAYERARREDRGGPQPRISVSPSERWEIAPSRTDPIPELHIKLFGGLEASIGGQAIEQTKLHRQKVKTLLALLALNQGKELLRPRLAAILWPESSADTAQRNFYAIWSMLRKALSNSAGDCPYLHRLQYGCKLDSQLVTSDIAEFDLLCNHLLFDQPDIEVWSGVYMRLNELYRGDLLPSESKNDFINQARNEYRARLVDALVAASTRLFEHGELQASMWFAHAGVRRDSTREDAYTALMRAQIATGQRTAALDTYFRCKSFLSDELGIDPSPQAMTLYQTIIAAEPNLSSFQPKTSLHS
ncbi:MAG: BTAD domain-containing putative transcriptional regulator, partial [Raoultibacter sp.]